MNCSKIDSFTPNAFRQNVSAAIGSANHEVGGHGEEEGASCGEKKPCDRAAVDGKVQEHINESHLKIKGRKGELQLFICSPFQTKSFMDSAPREMSSVQDKACGQITQPWHVCR